MPARDVAMGSNDGGLRHGALHRHTDVRKRRSELPVEGLEFLGAANRLSVWGRQTMNLRVRRQEAVDCSLLPAIPEFLEPRSDHRFRVHWHFAMPPSSIGKLPVSLDLDLTSNLALRLRRAV